MTRTLTQIMHVHLFEEIIKGRFRPFLPRYSDSLELKNILLEAQTQTVATLGPNEDVEAFILDTDFLTFGFKDVSDFDITQKAVPGNKTEIVVIPRKVYEGHEVLDIPYYTSFKTNIFLEMILDEFERVKIRAEKKLEITESHKELSVYAEKHIAKLKKLFYDVKVLLNDNHHRDDIYILMALSLIIIRTILFYQKMFKQFLVLPPDNQDQLKSVLFSSIALGRLKVLFDMRGSQYCSYIKKSYLQKYDTHDGNVEEPCDSGSETFSEKKSLQQERETQSYHPAKWNGQANVLMDLFIQLTEEIKVSGKPILETSPENLRELIMEFFVDKDSKRFSYHTVNTNLKSYRTDKRIKPKSPKKIDLMNILPKPDKE